MQMRTISAARFGWAGRAITAIAAVAALVVAAPRAQAQINKTNDIGAIRLGVFATTNSTTQRVYGRYYLSGGLDYEFQQNGIDQRDIVSVDYAEFNHSGKDIRIIPVTFGQQSVEAARGQGVRPYVGYGIGAYFVHVKNAQDSSFNGSDTQNKISLGGYFNVGLDLTNGLFLDARYHVMTPVHDVNTDGLEVTAGVRF